MPCFRGVYYNVKTTSGYHIPTGIIEFNAAPRLTNPACMSSIGEQFCFIGDKKFQAPKSSWYYFSFTAPVWNQYSDDTVKISVWYKLRVLPELDPQRIREFYDYAKHAGGRTTFTMSFSYFMLHTDTIWLENDMDHTLMIGPGQLQMEWMIYQYVAYNSTYPN